MKNITTLYNLLQRNKHVSLGIIIFLLLIISVSLIVSQSNKNTSRSITANLSPTPTPQPVPGKDYVPGHVMVKFKQTASPTDINQKLTQYNAKVIDKIDKVNASVLEVPEGQEKTVADKLINDGLVEYADIDHMYQDRFVPNDPQYSKQWALPMVKAPEAWDITKGKGVIIADIQNGGADVAHPDLAANAMPGGQGTIDHGTHTAGIIAAVGNNSVGVSGVCPECKLMMINVNGYSDSTVSKAITTATDGGAKAISMSFGGPSGGQALQDAITYAYGKGCISVAASGNEGENSLGGAPGDMQTVIDVASTDSSDKKSSFSNYNINMAIAAPGSSIISTLPGGKYGNMSGTSMATPLVAGVIGLIWSTPYGTSSDAVVKRLCDTADKITGTGTQWKCGRVNAFAAVQGATVSPSQPAQISPSTAQISTVPSQAPSQPVASQAPVTSGSPSPVSTQPTWFCAGSPNGICVTTSPSPANNNVPSTQPITVSVTQTTASPSSSVENPETQTPEEKPSTKHKKHKKHKQSNGLFNQLMELLQQILQLLEQFFSQSK